MEAESEPVATTASMLEEYDQQVPVLAQLSRDTRELVTRLLEERQIVVHEVNTRVKSRASLERKLRLREPPYPALTSVTDLVGIRVITYFSDDVDRVATIFEDEFQVDHQNSVDKRASLEPDRFGYMSLHYVCRLSAERIALREWSRFGQTRFEIQIRSILQHAWAEIEHDLGYHVEQAVPAQVRRRFSRLAGLLEIADSEFRGLRADVDEYQAQVAGSSATDLAELALDQDSVMAWIATEPIVKRLDVALSEDLGRLASDPDPSYIAKRVEEFTWLGVRTIADLLALMADEEERVAKFAAAWKPKSADVEVPRGVSLWFLFLLVAADRSPKGGPVALPPRHGLTGPRMARLLAAKARADAP